MDFIYTLLNKINGHRCVQANLNVWLIRSVFGEWQVAEYEVCCWVTSQDDTLGIGHKETTIQLHIASLRLRG